MVMTNKTASRPDIRDLILDGVDVLLARYGYSGMTMADLARQVGIGKGTIYLHFPSKEELALAHVDRIAERGLASLEVRARQEGPPEERLCSMLVDRVLVRFDSVVHYSESLNDLLSSIRRPLLARRQTHFEREVVVLAGVIAEGIAAGVFVPANPTETARALVWSTNAMLPFSLSARELGERGEMEARVRTIAHLLLRGLVRRTGEIQ
jgi:AcrR family transcriptional regulator